MKKILSVLLAFLLIFTLTPNISVYVRAEEETLDTIIDKIISNCYYDEENKMFLVYRDTATTNAEIMLMPKIGDCTEVPISSLRNFSNSTKEGYNYYFDATSDTKFYVKLNSEKNEITNIFAETSNGGQYDLKLVESSKIVSYSDLVSIIIVHM